MSQSFSFLCLNLSKCNPSAYDKIPSRKAKHCRLSGDSGHANVRDSPARTPDNVEDRHVTVREMSVHLGIDEASVCRILELMGLKQVCARWDLRMTTYADKETQTTMRSEHLAQYANGGHTSLPEL
jgi:hypothetical protein